jgi:monofunctional chorismate mutase
MGEHGATVARLERLRRAGPAPLRWPIVPVRALRGATTVDDDTPAQINEGVKALLHELFQRNGLSNDDVISLVVTGTADLRSYHPATAARAFGLHDVAILGAQEMEIDGTLPRCIRVLLHIETPVGKNELRHVFREGATVLRPDLADPDDADG